MADGSLDIMLFVKYLPIWRLLLLMAVNRVLADFRNNITRMEFITIGVVGLCDWLIALHGLGYYVAYHF